MENEQSQDIWQVEAGGSTYDGTFEDLAAWIGDGSVLRIDRVRKGNLRWIEAGKVPALLEFFNAKDASEPPPPVITTTKREVLGVPSRPDTFTNNQPSQPAAAGAASGIRLSHLPCQRSAAPAVRRPRDSVPVHAA